MIKCIISDMGNVVLKLDPGKACRRIAKIPYRPEYGEIGWFAPEEKTHRLMDSGRITKQDLYKMAKKNLGFEGLSQKQFEDAFGNVFTNNLPVQRIMKKLSENYTMALLTNTSPIHFEYVKKHFPIIKLFRYKVVSYKEGLTKPQRQIFRITLKRVRRKPSECVFVDDNPDNVNAAAGMGFKAIRYRTAPQLSSELRALGVEF